MVHATTSYEADPFVAVAEPRRRALLDELAAGERPVNDLVASLGWPQPTVSKHLGVLRAAGLVDVRDEGRQRIYRVNGERLRPVYEWAASFEKFWSRHADAIARRAEAKARARRKPKESKP